jgi:hypothetical protein
LDKVKHHALLLAITLLVPPIFSGCAIADQLKGKQYTSDSSEGSSQENFGPGDKAVAEKISTLLSSGAEVRLLVFPRSVEMTYPAPRSWYLGMENSIQAGYSKRYLDSFSHYPLFGILDRSVLDQLLSELNFQSTGAVDIAKVKQVGKIHGATHLLAIDFFRFGGDPRYFKTRETQQLIEIESSRVLATAIDLKDQDRNYIRQ